MKPNANSYLILSASLLALSSASAAVATKAASGTDLTGATAGVWSGGGGTNGSPNSSDIATWSGTSLGAGLTIATNVSWLGIDVQGAAGAIGITGAGTLTLGSSGVTIAAGGQDLSLGNAIALNANQTWTVNTGRSMTASSVVSGAFNLTRTGAGTLTLSNTANTFSGTVTLTGGTTSVTKLANGSTNSSLGSGSSSIIMNGATLAYTGAGGDTTNRAIDMRAGVAINNNSTTGTIAFTAANVIQGGTASARTLTLGGSYTGGSNSFASIIGDSGTGSNVTSFTKNGGSTWILSGVNTYTGTTTISAGTLAINAASGLGNGTSIVVANSSSTPMLQGNGDIVIPNTKTITVGNSTTLTAQSVFRNGGAAGTTFEIAAKITPGSGATGPVKMQSPITAGGIVRFSNDANDFGAFSTGSGIFEFTSVANGGSASALGKDTGAYALGNSLSSLTMRYVGSTSTSTNRNFDWQATTGGLTLDNSGNGTVQYLGTGNLKSGSGSSTLTLRGSNNGDNKLAQAVNDSGGTTSLSKQDAGKWLLTGSSTYTGATTVSAGTLLVNGSLGDTTVTVATNGTLGGAGTIGTNAVTQTVTINGTLAPGNSPGILTITDNLTLAGVLAMEIDGLTAGNGSGFHDQVALNGGGTLGGTLSLAWTLASAAPVNTELLLILNDGADALAGSFSNAANLSQHTDNLGNKWELRYAGGSGNDLTLVAIPEPSAAWLALIGLGMAARRRRD